MGLWEELEDEEWSYDENDEPVIQDGYELAARLLRHLEGPLGELDFIRELKIARSQLRILEATAEEQWVNEQLGSARLQVEAVLRRLLGGFVEPG